MNGPKDDLTSRRLGVLANRLEDSLGPAVTVERDDSTVPGCLVRVTPTRDDALGLVWMDLWGEVILETAGGPGGRWELSRSDEDLDLLEDIIESVVAGRVIEVFGPARSRVTVTLSGGRRLSERGARALEGCVPMPFWTKWGRKVRYSPYTEDLTA